MEKFPTNSESKKAPQFPKVTDEILKLIEIDQDMREGPDEDWDDSVDLQNTEAMKRIVASIGWPTTSKVGEEASREASLLVRHADHDPEFQKECLLLMQAEPESEVTLKDRAFLEDRIRVNLKQGQVYGTQMNEERDRVTGELIAYKPKLIEIPESVDKRRALMGLEPLEEYVKEITGRYYPELLRDK
jgi:hypothetical protein